MKADKIRIAFTLFGDCSWTGGINYLRNLFSALSILPGRPLEPVLFISPDTNQDVIDSLRIYLNEPPIIVSAWKNTKWNKIRQLFENGILQKDKKSLGAFQEAKIDVVFQNDAWYGFKFSIPTLVWIADFQHKHLGEMFTPYRRLKRDLAYSMLCRSATKVMVSSEDAGQDCKKYFSGSKEKVTVAPFAINLEDTVLSVEPSEVLKEYHLPEQYYYFPGQLWKHKNHLALLDALSLLKEMNSDVVVVASGNPQDRRNPEHPDKVLDLVEKKGLQRYFRFLGMVPYEHIMPLMRKSVAMINPSLFEGWSTTVEEAKAIGVPMLLSDLRVHKEQAPQLCRFFNPRDSKEIAKVMHETWQEWKPGPRYKTEREAFDSYSEKKIIFARKFEKIVRDLIVNEN